MDGGEELLGLDGQWNVGNVGRAVVLVSKIEDLRLMGFGGSVAEVLLVATWKWFSRTIASWESSGAVLFYHGVGAEAR